MSSNYPPGATGAEPEIVGESDDEKERRLAVCTCGKPRHPSLPVCRDCWMDAAARLSSRPPKRAR